MDVREESRRRGRETLSGESESAARLAPLEERNGAATNHQGADEGVISVNTGELKVPQELTEEEEKVKKFLPMDPAVLAILCFALLFILAITYVIWNGWEPPR